MKITLVALAALLAASPLMAQERGTTGERGYLMGVGGFSVALGDHTANTLVEGGVRVARHVFVFGNVGRFSNLEGDLTPSLDAAASAIADTQGIGVNASGKLPATYGLGGVRLEIPAGGRVMPYLLGGVGVARLKPSTSLTYSSGLMPDGSTPDVGSDITSNMIAIGAFASPQPSHVTMATFGAGLQIPVVSHWVIDAGYRYSRLAADTALQGTALNTNGMTVGFGYRF
jgi:opacity protein-like surface antigen